MLKNIWKDPVWSKVIAGIILAIIGGLISCLWQNIKETVLLLWPIFTCAIKQNRSSISVALLILLLLFAVLKRVRYSALLKQKSLQKNPMVSAQIDQSQSDKLYSKLVDSATKNLFLHRWQDIGDYANSGILYGDFVNGVGIFGTKVFRTIWPGNKPRLENAIKNLSKRLDDFVRHFCSFAVLENNVWKEDKSWKKKELQKT